MFHFEHPSYFYLLFALPLLAGLFWLMQRQDDQLRQRFGALFGLERLAPNYARYKRPFKFALGLGALTFLILALANPRMGHKTQTVNREGVDVYIALDVSRSMWAEDVKPNRMERARQLTQKIIQGVKGDRVGLILFAGHPYLQMPLTVDYAAAQLFARTASPQLDITQGTAIGSAIDLVVEVSAKAEKQHQQAIVVITDGENHETESIETAKAALEKGIRTFIIGVGTEAGAPIPLRQAGRKTFQVNKQGQIVQSKMNTALVREIAQAGGGKFYSTTTASDGIVNRLTKELNRLERNSFEQQEFDVYKSYFQYGVALALLLLVLEFVTNYRKNRWFRA